MKKELVPFIPLDKSWIIRMGILDMINGYDDINKFLASQDKESLGDDLQSLLKSANSWKKDESVDVGESGTIFRFLKFISWKKGLNKRFIISGTLKNRRITDDESVIDLSQGDLLKLDNGTSQWASIKAMTGDTERLLNAPYKLLLTYEAIDHWNKMRNEGQPWQPKYDETIAKQAEFYLDLLAGKKIDFEPRHAEDYCFSYVFGYIDEVVGEKRWPSLRGHESDRIDGMTAELANAKSGRPIGSKDHRVIQAIVMWANVNDKRAEILYPKSVNKSWPQFWKFIDYANKIKIKK